jgi:alkaline phosphatase
VVNGHIHNYERFVEMDAVGEAKSPGLRQIIVGTGGVNHYGFINPLSTSQSAILHVWRIELIPDATSYSWVYPVEGKSLQTAANGCRGVAELAINLRHQ